MTHTLDQIQAVLAQKGYEFFDDGTSYRLNIISVRTDSAVPDSFDDELYLLYRDSDAVMQVMSFPVTTDPGLKTLLKPVNAKGTAILVPKQYRDAYTIRKHQGKYDAVCQSGPVTVWRDNNRDAVLDFENAVEDSGLFGINIHRSNPRTESTIVGGWSAGCTVFKRVRDFYFFMKQAYKATEVHGKFLSYTLLTQQDFSHLPRPRSGPDDLDSPATQTREQVAASSEIEALNARFMDILDALEDRELAEFLLAERDGLAETVDMLLSDLARCEDSPEKTRLIEELLAEKEQLSRALAWYKQQLEAGSALPATNKIIAYITERNEARHDRLGQINKKVAALELQQDRR